jgi:BlaI family transcriptional regulator, penicillinase repressor
MTSMHTLPDLNDTELAVLKALWRERRLSARELHERLGAAQGWAASTTRTTLDRMAAKGLLRKQPFHGLNLYEPAVSRPAALARRVRDFAGRVLEIDWPPVVSLFAESEALSAEEVDELERLLAASEVAGDVDGDVDGDADGEDDVDGEDGEPKVGEA